MGGSSATSPVTTRRARSVWLLRFVTKDGPRRSVSSYRFTGKTVPSFLWESEPVTSKESYWFSVVFIRGPGWRGPPARVHVTPDRRKRSFGEQSNGCVCVCCISTSFFFAHKLDPPLVLWLLNGKRSCYLSLENK